MCFTRLFQVHSFDLDCKIAWELANIFHVDSRGLRVYQILPSSHCSIYISYRPVTQPLFKDEIYGGLARNGSCGSGFKPMTGYRMQVACLLRAGQSAGRKSKSARKL
jgi:hypothetical protein